MALCPGLPGWTGTRRVKPIWILLKQETVSGSGIGWAMCKPAPRSWQITMPAPRCSVFLQAGCPSCHPTSSVKALKALSLKSVHWLFYYTHTHPFNGPLSGTTRVSRYQKGKTNLDFIGARDSEWHQLGHMQVCTLLETDNHTSTPPLSFLQAGCPSCCPTNSVKALTWLLHTHQDLNVKISHYSYVYVWQQ